MGNSHCRPVVEFNDINSLLTHSELGSIKDEFKSLSSRLKDKPEKPLVVSKERFLLRYLAPRLNQFDGAVIERCFEVFNFNGEAGLDLDEFACAVFILDYASREELLKCKSVQNSSSNIW